VGVADSWTLQSQRAVGQSARLWTLNPAGFQDIPGLELHRS
jgi:hypothetical protein